MHSLGSKAAQSGDSIAKMADAAMPPKTVTRAAKIQRK